MGAGIISENCITCGFTGAAPCPGPRAALCGRAGEADAICPLREYRAGPGGPTAHGAEKPDRVIPAWFAVYRYFGKREADPRVVLRPPRKDQEGRCSKRNKKPPLCKGRCHRR